jgi:hypothetical protein
VPSERHVIGIHSVFEARSAPASGIRDRTSGHFVVSPERGIGSNCREVQVRGRSAATVRGPMCATPEHAAQEMLDQHAISVA